MTPLFYLIPGIVIVASLVAILFIIAKKFPHIANINIESIAKEKENKVINRIMIERLARKMVQSKRFIKEISLPITDVAGKSFNKFYQKILDLEKKTFKKQPLKQIDINQDVKDKITEVQRLMFEQDFEQAENLAVEVISLNQKNLDAYEALVDIYIEIKDYKKARETSKFLTKLLVQEKKEKKDSTSIHRLANCYAELGYIYELEGKHPIALKNYQKAVILEPNNPRFLDLLLKISIILENKPLAQEVFESLKEADPDNGKLVELKEQIEAIVVKEPAQP